MTHYLYAAIVLAAAAAGWFGNGWRLNAEIAEQKLTIANQAETLRLASQHKINRIDAAGAAKARKQAPIDQSILAKAETNVPTTLPLLPPGFRVQHDSAATGEEISNPSAADAAPVAPVTVAKTITRNYTSARVNAADLEELQAIIRASGCFEFDGE